MNHLLETKNLSRWVRDQFSLTLRKAHQNARVRFNVHFMDLDCAKPTLFIKKNLPIEEMIILFCLIHGVRHG